MEAINYQTKTIVICPPRIASEHLENVAEQNINGWTNTFGSTINEYANQGYKILGAVRHPISRFKSWFNGFILHDNRINNFHEYPSNPRKWTVLDVEDFFEHFVISMHYDTHTQYQKFIYKNMNIDSIEFFDHRYLDSSILKISKTPHTYNSNKKPFFYHADNKVEDLIIEYANWAYRDDIIWYENIKK